MTEIRCVKCNRLLMKGQVFQAEIKCPKCGYLNHLRTISTLNWNEKGVTGLDFQEKID